MVIVIFSPNCVIPSTQFQDIFNTTFLYLYLWKVFQKFQNSKFFQILSLGRSTFNKGLVKWYSNFGLLCEYLYSLLFPYFFTSVLLFISSFFYFYISFYLLSPNIYYLWLIFLISFVTSTYILKIFNTFGVKSLSSNPWVKLPEVNNPSDLYQKWISWT